MFNFYQYNHKKQKLFGNTLNNGVGNMRYASDNNGITYKNGNS